MNSKSRFTLIEIVVIITVISILLSIVLIKTVDLKKKAVANSISSNIAILQTASDSYYLKEESYPSENNAELTLSNPQLIDIEKLRKEGYLKKNLDLSKIKHQYYWIDIFGRVWGATTQEVNSINLLKNKSGEKNLEFLIDNKFSGFDIYEVIGYSSLANKNNTNNLYAELNDNQKKSYKVIDSVEFAGGEKELVNFKLPNENANYLVSFKDDYGLELPPMGKFSGKTSMYLKDGTYNFEIESEEVMYWIDFLTLEDKKGDSTINYRFKVKDEKGEFLPWTEDFFSLPESKHIVVEIELKSDAEGNRAAIYDIQVLFKYKDEIILEPKPLDCDFDCYDVAKETCPQVPIQSTFTNGTSGIKVVPFYIKNKQSIENTYISQPVTSSVYYNIKEVKYYVEVNGQYVLTENLQQLLQEKCGFAVFDIEVKKPPTKKTEQTMICGTGGTQTSLNSSVKRIVYTYYINENTQINAIEIKNGHDLTNVYFEQSVNGQPFEIISSMSEIKSPSCVNVVYEFEGDIGKPNPPVLKGCTGDCPPVKVCEVNCISEGPNCLFECTNTGGGGGSDDCKESNCEKPKGFCQTEFDKCDNPPCEDNCNPVNADPEWTTVETVRFFASGPLNRDTRWYKVITDEEIYNEKNTQIVYNYSKKVSGDSWSGLYENFETTGVAQSVMAIGFIQVRTSELKNVPESEYPIIKSVIFKSELGDLTASMTNPSLVITPKKNNNVGRDIFSTESIITWDVAVADPRNLKITNIEWDGDIREQYPVGKYVVKARATNERGNMSEWISYELEVVQEKPMANFTFAGGVIYLPIGESISFDTSKSIDPDGDEIVNYEWKNKKTKYDKGDLGLLNISLRVQDSDGYWSDWFVQEFDIYDPEDNLWYVDGKPAIPAGFRNMFDGNEGTYNSFKEETSKLTVTWSKDITGKTINFIGDAQVNFYDKNNQLIPYISNQLTYTTSSKLTEYKLNAKIIIPKNAVKMDILKAKPYGTWNINDISLLENDSLTLGDLKTTSTSFTVESNWTKSGDIKTVYFVDLATNKFYSSTSTSIKISSLTPETTYKFMVFGVDSQFNATEPKVIEVTTEDAGVVFYGISVDGYDNNKSTHATTTSSGATITWNKDLTNKTLGIEGSLYYISFYDKDGKQLPFFSNNYGYTTETTNYNATNLRFIVPEGAVSMKLRSYYTGNNGYVTELSVIEPTTEVTKPSNVTFSSEEYSITANWTKASNQYRVYVGSETSSVGAYSTENKVTVNGLTPSTKHKFRVIAVDSNFIASEMIVADVITKSPEVNFYGVGVKVLDGLSDTFESFPSKQATITWDKDISGRSLYFNAQSLTGTFYDKDGNALKVTSTSETFKTNSTREATVTVPAGATSLIVKGDYSGLVIYTMKLK